MPPSANGAPTISAGPPGRAGKSTAIGMKIRRGFGRISSISWSPKARRPADRDRWPIPTRGPCRSLRPAAIIGGCERIPVGRVGVRSEVEDAMKRSYHWVRISVALTAVVAVVAGGWRLGPRQAEAGSGALQAEGREAVKAG